MAEDRTAPATTAGGRVGTRETGGDEPTGDPDPCRAAGRDHGRRLRPGPAPDRRLRRGRGGPLDPDRSSSSPPSPGRPGLAYVANAAPSHILVPGLSWPHAVGADLAGRAVVSTIPGPTDIATRFVLYRQWAIPADTATAGIVFNAFFETLSDLVLPLIATLGVLLAGHAPRPTVAALSLIGVVILVFAMLLLVAIVRSESLAGRLGRLLESVAGRLWRLFRRPPPWGSPRA